MSSDLPVPDPRTIDKNRTCGSIAAATASKPESGHIRVFYQTPDGGIRMSEFLNGSWGGGSSGDPIFKAVLLTPLAAIAFNGGNEVRVYYLDEQYILQEYCYSADKKSWNPGEIGSMNIQAATTTSIAATQFEDAQGGVHIHVYCQESGSDAIKEFSDDGKWFRGAVLPVALCSSRLAVANFLLSDLHDLYIHVYYQADNRSVREYCFDKNEWTPGRLDFGKPQGCVPIGTHGYITADGHARLHVYWNNTQTEIVETVYTNSWGPANKVITNFMPGTQIAVVQFNNGNNLRLYYQASDEYILEMSNNGDLWVGGALSLELLEQMATL